MKTLHKITGKINLVCYLMLLYQIWHLCQYGGVKRHLLLMLPFAWVFLISLILWLVSFQRRSKDVRRSKAGRILFRAEIAVCLVATVYFAGHIIPWAVSSREALAGKLDEALGERNVRLKHDNFFKDGAEGALEDLDEALNLPEDLYISGSCQMTFDETGTIKTIDTLLYGKDEDGNTRTYLVDYDSDRGGNMTVRTNVRTNETFDPDMRLEPMFRILEEAAYESPYEDLVSAWAEQRGNEIYGILYKGRRSFTSYDGLVFLSGDADGDGRAREDGQLSRLLDEGGEITGFEVSLYIPDEGEVTPVRYIMEAEYHNREEVKEEQEQQQTEAARQSDTWTVDSSDGTVYFFFSDTLGWRLTVADAAAGSRFYRLEKTEDGGNSWKTANADPFAGQIGVAEGLIFYDGNLGIAGLTNASESSSRLYRTTDGGTTFTELLLPFSTVTELPEHAADYGLTITDYDYLSMPEQEGETLTVKAIPQAGEQEGILFRSTDNGATWTCAGTFSS